MKKLLMGLLNIWGQLYCERISKCGMRRSGLTILFFQRLALLVIQVNVHQMVKVGHKIK